MNGIIYSTFILRIADYLFLWQMFRNISSNQLNAREMYVP